MRTKMFSLLSVIALMTPATAAPVELPEGTPDAIRRDMATIDHYRAEVERRTNRNIQNNGGAAPPAPEVVAGVGTGAEAPEPPASSVFSPLTIAPPRTSITPDAPAGERGGAPERDPFEVSPQLRESGSRNTRASMQQQEGVTLNRYLRLKAMVRGPEGGMAQIQSGKELFIVYDGDELDVNGIRYTVHIERDGLVLRGAGMPQYKMLVR